MIKFRITFALLALLLSMVSCNASKNEETHYDLHEEFEEVHLSEHQLKRLGVHFDTLQQHVFQGIVNVSGRLEVPPQYEATATAMLGGNISQILVMEGETVRKGQVLVYLQHPNYIALQTDYMKSYHQNEFLTAEYHRQKRLEDAEVGAKKDFQKIEAELLINKAEMNGYEAQLRLLKLDLKRIQNGNIYDQIPILSPIDGSIEGVGVQLGQYADAQTKLFYIVNTEHVHADFMVFENDVMAVKKGQKVQFRIGNSPRIFNATIISVGKQFEDNPKALHIHADIDEEDEKGVNFISGMFIRGKIFTASIAEIAVKESAVVSDEGKDYIFYVKSSPKDENDEYYFRMIEVKELRRERGWISIEVIGNLPDNALVVQDGAYYLISEMKKGDLEHDH